MEKTIIRNVILGLFLVLCYQISNTYFRDLTCSERYHLEKSTSFNAKVKRKYETMWKKAKFLDLVLPNGERKQLDTWGITDLNHYVSVGDSLFKEKGKNYYVVKKRNVYQKFYIEYGVGCSE